MSAGLMTMFVSLMKYVSLSARRHRSLTLLLLRLLLLLLLGRLHLHRSLLWGNFRHRVQRYRASHDLS